MSPADVIPFDPHSSPPRPPAATTESAQRSAAAAARGHVLDYVRVLSRRRGTLVTAFTLVVTLVALYVFTTPPVWEARARLLIDAGNENVVNFKEVVEQNRATADYYQTQYKLLQNRPLVKKTIDTLRLWDLPEFGGSQEPDGVSIRTRVASAVHAGAGFLARLVRLRTVGHRDRAAAETAREARAIDAFLGHLTISPIRNSRLVDVQFQSTDPELAAKVVNALARGYIEQMLDQNLQVSKDASEWLSRALASQRHGVETAELALQRYREEHDAVSVEERQNIVVQKLADLNAAVTRAKTMRIEKEAAYERLRAIQSDHTALDTFPGIMSNSFIQQLKAELVGLQRQQAQLSDRYAERHPEMIKTASAIETARAKLDGEIAKVVESIRNDYLVSLAQERQLLAALEAQKLEALALNKKAIEYAALQREAVSTRQLFESLLQRVKETSVSADLRTMHIRVVEPADVPQAPVQPNKTNALVGSVVGGALFAIGLAFLFEYVDDRIKAPEEIKTHLGLPYLGLIPMIPDRELGARAPLVNAPLPPVFKEALRTVRTNVLFASADTGPRSVLVTSTAPGEGKTTVASNLAVALAQAGRRTLLIDGDMRRPAVHEMFGIDAEPGLSNLIVGDAKPSQVVRNTSIPSLWILPAGVIAPNPAELLGAPVLTKFLRSLSTYFDWVVIDSPPVQAVADASILAHATSGVVFVVGAEMISRRAAQAAVEQLESARAKFVGAVLNRVDLDRNAYYYSRYYRRAYGQYYASAR